MQSFDKNPTSTPIKRLGVSLNVDTGYNKGKGRDISPPLTPQENYPSNKGNTMAGNQALKPRNGPRETFLDDITPINASSSRVNEQDRGRGNRDSHDLSLSPRQVTRDSLVDHMLLSLDQFSLGQEEFGRQPTVEEEQLYSSFDNEEGYQTTSNFAARNARGVGHTYSYSSDYENADDSSKYSGRGRRSNSSSNFQTTGRIENKRPGAGANSSFGSSTFGGSRVPPPSIPPRGIHSRSGKGSKGSSANSFDLGYAQPTGTQRWAHGLLGRSSSFDYGSDRQANNNQSTTVLRQIDTNAAPFSPYDYEAAPTPTVPVGPRRMRPPSPIMIPEPPPTEPPQRIERKRSTRSSKSGYKGKLSGNPSSGGRFDYGLKDRNRELPPMPAFMKDIAPAPHVGYGKTKDIPQASAPTNHVAKERPGFFRRVFGSRNSPAHVPEPPPSHGSATSAETTERPTSKVHHIGTQMKSQQNAAPPRETPPTPKEHTHVLSKKPSSFFRRRKKSVSETAAVPVPVVPPLKFPVERELAIEKIPPSPVSSLRKVMNPYLRTPLRSPIDPFPKEVIDRQMNASPELHRTTRGFSSDYEPDKSATIRTVGPSENEREDVHDAAQNPYQTSLRSNSRGGPDGSRDENGTFLQDSSDTDRDAARLNAGHADSLEPPWLHNARISSPEVARDMALVAEYERVHSRRSPTPSKLEQRSPSPLPPNASQSSVDAGSSLKKTTIPMPARDEEWIMLTPTKLAAKAEEDRVWLDPSSSEDDLPSSKLALPPNLKNKSNRTSGSTDTVYKSATSLPILQIDGEAPVESPPRKLMTAAEAIKSLDGPPEVSDELVPVEGDREKAKKIYDGNEDFIQKEKAAAWMGEEGPARERTLTAYMELYDFTNLNILAALRLMCGRLLLKAESQQVDRILVAFSKRWCQCNSDHGFKGNDIVHTICYSILLLNTDLHLADIEQKMTRSQFIKNTMPTIRKCVSDSVPDAFDSSRPSVLPGKGSAFNPENSKADLKPERSSVEMERPSWRSSFKPPPRVDSDGNTPTPLDYDTPMDDCGPLVKAPFHGTMRTWEVQVEIVLKDFYNAIRNERLPLFGAPAEKPQLQGPSTNTLSVFTNGMLRRSPSVLSKAPSESQTYARGRTAETVRVGNGKWANKNRSRPRLYPGSVMGSSRTSLDDQSSMWSPSVSSSTWSKYSLGKTQTSMSVDSFASSMPQGDYQQSIGFANALSQAIIREETVGSIGSGASDRDEPRVTPLLEDESLELAGAPWAKEGIVKHKHHLESVDKKAKDRNWNETFAVIEKGYMSLFSFNTKTIRNKPKAKGFGGVVGGGNWQDNAESLGSFLLRQTIASALPSPGYSKARPHVWALSLPSGAVHLFQVGTPEIVREFVSTANYWSARLSNHPLVGGISNIEYGWSDAIVNNALVTAINDSTRERPSTSGPRPSIQSSIRSSSDLGYSTGSVRARLPGDKINISDWTPPTQSMRASNLMEQDQLRTLTDYVNGIEEELQKHNQLRSPMLLAFTPRHPNSSKAMANWEKKSSYLLREIVKFRTYIDCLHAAEVGKQKIYAEREARIALEQRAAEHDDDEADTTLKLQ